MKKYQKFLFAGALCGLVLLTQSANARVERDCARFKVGKVTFSTCEANYRPGPRWHHRDDWRWRQGRWHRHDHFERCTVRVTPWGRERHCERW